MFSSRCFLPLSADGRSLMLCLLYLAAMLPVQAAETRTNALGMTFVFVPAGEFEMGTTPAQIERVAAEMETPEPDRFSDETPKHTVVIGRGFWLQQTEATQAQWLDVMENRPGPAKYWQREQWRSLPVVSVSWHMAQEFVEELNRRDTAFRYRLPTEAEWEYAARAGSGVVRPHPEGALTEHAWFIENSGDVPHPVATRKPNAFGLYDMLGNAWEWVQDRYHPATYRAGRRVNPQGPETGNKRVRRGGSYHCPSWQTRPGYRAADTPNTAYSVIGLRVVAEQMP